MDGQKRKLAPETIEPDRSILALRRDPEVYPELSWLAQSYEKIRIYREWAFGRNAVFREPQKADTRNDLLEEDFSNLGLFLNRLKTRFPVAKRAILKGLKDLYGGIGDFDVFIEGGTVQVFFTEGDFVIHPPFGWHTALPLSSGNSLRPRTTSAHLHRGAGAWPSSGRPSNGGRPSACRFETHSDPRDYPFGHPR
jgi:hypothetical protein